MDLPSGGNALPVISHRLRSEVQATRVRGSVHRIGGRVRITAQLIETASDSHIWAKDYEGEVQDMLRLEAEVSRSIAQEIRAQLTSDESTRFEIAKRIDPVAQDEFLMGTAERWKATPGGFLKAVDQSRCD